MTELLFKGWQLKNRSIFLCVAIFVIFTAIVACKKQEVVTSVILDHQNYAPRATTQEIKKAQTPPAYAVVTVDRLRVRTSNDTYAKTIRYLDQGTMVDVLSKGKERIRINDLEDYWYKIEYKGIKGWIFGYYLELYTNYSDAREATKKFTLEKEGEDEYSAQMGDDFSNRFINNNLMFISGGSLFVVSDYAQNEATKLAIDDELNVVSYFIDKTNTDTIYYLGKDRLYKSRASKTPNLYRFNNATGENELIQKSVVRAAFDYGNRYAVVVCKEDGATRGSEVWHLRKIGLDDSENTSITSIEKGDDLAMILEPLYMSMSREKGNSIYLELDHEKSIVYFQPPEADQAYLVSLLDGSFIRVQLSTDDCVVVDSNRTVFVDSSIDNLGEVSYSIMLKDNISGYTKEIIKSTNNPIHFEVHPYKDLVAVSMLQINDSTAAGTCYPSFIYLLSLSSFTITPVRVNGDSYQPQWKK